MMKKILIGVGVAILLIIFAGIYEFNYLSNQVGYDVDGNKIQVENEEQMIRSVSPTEFQNLVKSNKYTIIDVRTPDEFKNEALFTDALNIDFYESDFRENLAKLDLDGNYLIYCRSGNRTGQTLKTMKEMGFKNVADLTGGRNAWLQTFK